MRTRKFIVSVGIVLIVATASGVASASLRSSTVTTSGKGPRIFSTQVAGPNIPLVSQEKVVLTSPALPAGNYLMTFDVTLLLRPETNVDCHILINGSRPDLMSGAAGAGSGEFAPIYAADHESYVIHLSDSAAHVQVVCGQGGSPSSGSSTGAVRMLTLEQVGNWTLQSS